MIISPNDPGTLIVAANHVFVSHDRGDSWTVISPDLTTNANRDTIVTMGLKGADIRISRDDGVSQWPAIVTLAESPKQPGVYYTGSDDGLVYVSRDGGKTWQNITKNLPGFPAGALGQRGRAVGVRRRHGLRDGRQPPAQRLRAVHLGEQRLRRDVPLDRRQPRTAKSSRRSPKISAIATCSTSARRRASSSRSIAARAGQRLKANSPDVRVDEITLHPRDNAMLVATHGRALWMLDHLEPIQEYAAAQSGATRSCSRVPTALEWKTKDDRNDEFWGHQYFIGENPPNEAVVQYFLKSPMSDLTLRVNDAAGKTVRERDDSEREVAARNPDGVLGHARRADHGRGGLRGGRWRSWWTRRRRWRRRPRWSRRTGGAGRAATSSQRGLPPDESVRDAD